MQTPPTPTVYNYSPKQSEAMGKYFPTLTEKQEKNLQSYLKNKHPELSPEQRFEKAKTYVEKKETVSKEISTYQP